ncbi:MAG: hypothetical protein AUH11_05235 [Acidobacteria bacterium 13_2_20CM_57_17]|nr:MAG: hypothetical protein AUH11_05235 [Acidobacteria bacterium 13_2_20CM_57_17]
MKADISTLHKPDILILRRQARASACEKPLTMLLLHFPKQLAANQSRGHTAMWARRGLRIRYTAV